MNVFLILILILFIGCDGQSTDKDIDDGKGSEIFVTLQDSDYIAIVRASDLSLLDTIKINLNEMDMMGMNEAPHDVAIDGQNNYWFTTAMMGEHLGMYSTETNELVSSYPIAQMPALLSLDKINMKVYVSRGMTGNGIETNIVYELSYANGALELVNEWPVLFEYAHGIHFDQTSGNVFVVSKTNDYIAKINPNEPVSEGNNPMLVSMDIETATNPTIPINRLRPIHISAKYPYMFITCSAGEWMANQESYDEINGQVQMWHMDDVNLLATLEFGLYSRPWHIEVSPLEDKIFVALAGGSEDSESDSGVACIEYGIGSGNSDDPYFMNESWITTSSEYGTLHGITIESNCEGDYFVYATGRTNGTIYKFDPDTGNEISRTNLTDSGNAATGGIDINFSCGDTCCD